LILSGKSRYNRFVSGGATFMVNGVSAMVMMAAASRYAGRERMAGSTSGKPPERAPPFSGIFRLATRFFYTCQHDLPAG